MHLLLPCPEKTAPFLLRKWTTSSRALNESIRERGKGGAGWMNGYYLSLCSRIRTVRFASVLSITLSALTWLEPIGLASRPVTELLRPQKTLTRQNGPHRQLPKQPRQEHERACLTHTKFQGHSHGCFTQSTPARVWTDPWAHVRVFMPAHQDVERSCGDACRQK